MNVDAMHFSVYEASVFVLDLSFSLGIFLGLFTPLLHAIEMDTDHPGTCPGSPVGQPNSLVWMQFE